LFIKENVFSLIRKLDKEVKYMPFALKAVAGIGGSILAIIALVIAVLKGLLALIGFITTAIQIVVVLLFVAVFVGIGLMVFRTWRSSRRSKE
jgi:uncharacterized membrane protein